MRKLLLPITITCLFLAACGGEKSEESKDEGAKGEVKAEASEMTNLQTQVNKFCKCVEEGGDCSELQEKVDKAGKTYAEKLKEADDKKKLGELMDLYKEFKDCANKLTMNDSPGEKDGPISDGGSALEAFEAAVNGFCECQSKGEDCISFQMDIKKYGDAIKGAIEAGDASLQEGYATASQKMLDCL